MVDRIRTAADRVLPARILNFNSAIERDKLKTFLDRKVKEFNRPSFIPNDPVCIPHGFSKQQDIEIAALFAALFAWGNRTTIINKSRQLMQLMDNAPHEFCIGQDRQTQKILKGFKHRTFNDIDLLYFVRFLRYHYSRHVSLETAFFGPEMKDNKPTAHSVESGLDYFQNYFFSLDNAPARTRKHIAAPSKNATCKRLNMFLRWMVRNDKNGVDFGIWKLIKPSQLISPVDIHVSRVARNFGLITRAQNDWQTALELTANLQQLDRKDPVKYDFALFSLGVNEHF